jgi:hypothetical protein
MSDFVVEPDIHLLSGKEALFLYLREEAFLIAKKLLLEPLGSVIYILAGYDQNAQRPFRTDAS